MNPPAPAPAVAARCGAVGLRRFFDLFDVRAIVGDGRVAGVEPLYPPCSAGDHLAEMYRKTYGIAA